VDGGEPEEGALPPSPRQAAPLPDPGTPSPVAQQEPEFVTQIEDNEDMLDAFHNESPVRYRQMDSVIGKDLPVPGQAQRVLPPGRVQEELQFVAGGSELRTFAEADQDQAWRVVMQEEIDSIQENHTWELTELSRGCRAIGLKWVFKQKKDESGAVIKNKARLVAKGYVLQAGVDFDEVFAPVARMESVRLVLALAADEGWEVHHMDVKTTFLNGELAKEVYVQQSERFITAGEEHKVLRLRRALYGLRQAPWAWYEKLDGTLHKLGFT
jgi:hypothetical protein